MKHLAPSLWVPIVPTIPQSITWKRCLWDDSIVRVVLPWCAGNVLVVQVVAPGRSSSAAVWQLSPQEFPGVSQFAALAELKPKDKHLGDQHHLANRCGCWVKPFNKKVRYSKVSSCRVIIETKYPDGFMVCRSVKRSIHSLSGCFVLGWHKLYSQKEEVVFTAWWDSLRFQFLRV